MCRARRPQRVLQAFMLVCYPLECVCCCCTPLMLRAPVPIQACPPPARFVLGRLPRYADEYLPAGCAWFALRMAAADVKFWALAGALQAAGQPALARKLQAGSRVRAANPIP